MSIKRIFIAISAIFATSAVFADNSSVTSKKYVDDLMSGYQGKLPGSGANKLMIYDDETGIGEKAIAATLGNSASATSVPTVGAVKTGLDGKQDAINGTAGYVMTGTGTPGDVGEKPIYGTTTNYSDSLVTAEAVNTGVINAVNSSLIRVDENGYPSNTGTLWEINTDLIAINANVPYGYTELQYIEFDGNTYIDTGITPLNSGATINMKITPSTMANLQFLYGQNPTEGMQQVGCFLYTNGKISWQYSALRLVTDVVAVGTTYDITLGNGSVTINGTTITGTPDTPFTTNMTVLVGAAWASNYTSVDGRRFVGKVYAFSYKLGGQTLVNLVPAKNSSNVVGMYDTVSGTFFTNAGDGNFTAGPPVVGN